MEGTNGIIKFLHSLISRTNANVENKCPSTTDQKLAVVERDTLALKLSNVEHLNGRRD